jgi:hypothetical protein
MTSRFDWAGMLPFVAISVVAVALTVWQVVVDRSVFDRFLGGLDPVGVMVGTAVVGTVALAYLQASSDFAVSGPGGRIDAVTFIAWTVPLFAAAAIGADLVLRFDEDTNVAMPDALRFYPAIAVFVEIALQMPGDFDLTFWRIAIPVALIEAVLQASYATSVGTAIFSAVHLVVFGVVQVWVFWRYGFVWMLGFRLAYYALWHLVWGAVRLELLF